MAIVHNPSCPKNQTLLENGFGSFRSLNRAAWSRWGPPTGSSRARCIPTPRRCSPPCRCPTRSRADPGCAFPARCPARRTCRPDAYFTPDVPRSSRRAPQASRTCLRRSPVTSSHAISTRKTTETNSSPSRQHPREEEGEPEPAVRFCPKNRLNSHKNLPEREMIRKRT